MYILHLLFFAIQLLQCNASRIREYSVPSMFKLQDEFTNTLIDEPGRYAGYFRLNRTESAEMFYWYFENRDKDENAPWAIWLNGGPGCSSSTGLFFEKMGPYIVDYDTLEISENPYGWDRSLNILFVDQPIGVGFSYSDAPEDRVFDEERLSEDMLDFVLTFLEVHPEMKFRDFYITGESYAGSYIPHIAKRLHDYQKSTKGTPVNLAGIAIGNGWTVPEVQYLSYSEFAYDEGLLGSVSYYFMKTIEPVCSKLVNWCESSKSKTVCEFSTSICFFTTLNTVLSLNPGINVYDIRDDCAYSPLCYNLGWMSRLLNSPKIQAELGVARNWVECSDSVYSDFMYDMSLRADREVAYLLDEGVNVLLYSGDKDLICNWYGNILWSFYMQWSGMYDLWYADVKYWVSGRKAAGELVRADPLTILVLYDAGHMVPYDQPARALQMITEFTKQGGLNGMAVKNGEEVSKGWNKKCEHGCVSQLID